MAQREKRGRAGATARHWRTRPARQRERERESERAKKIVADRSAPLGNEREREGAHEGEPSLTGGVRLLGGTGARARGLAGLLSPFLFLWIF
jgi:hypothetical protein